MVEEFNSSSTTPEPLVVDIARTEEDKRGAMDLRIKEFVIKQGVLYNHEVDGNDNSCTHIVAKQGDKVVGTVRIRYFKDFVRLERFCKDRDANVKGVVPAMLDYMKNFLSEKGYSDTHCFCEEELAKHWLKNGHELVEGADTVQIGHMKLYAVNLKLAPKESHVSIYSHPDVLTAAEGKWDLSLNSPVPEGYNVKKEVMKVKQKLSANKGKSEVAEMSAETSGKEETIETNGKNKKSKRSAGEEAALDYIIKVTLKINSKKSSKEQNPCHNISIPNHVTFANYNRTTA